MSQKLKKSIDFFIHEDLVYPQRRTAEYIVMASAVILSSTTLNTILNYSMGLYRAALMSCLTYAGVILALMGLRYLAKVTLAVYTILVFSIASVALSTLSFGGLINANIFWLMVMPLGVALVLDIKHAAITVVLCFIATVFVLVFSPDNLTQMELDRFAIFKSTSFFVINTVILVGLAFALIYRKQMQEINKQLADRNQSIENIVNNVQTSFLMIGRDMLIKAGYSRACLQIFNRKELTGLDFASLIRSNSVQVEEYRLALQQVFDDCLPEEVTLSNLPKLIDFGESEHFSIEGKVIRDQSSVIQSLLFTIKDISNQIKAETESRRNLFLLQNIRNREGLLSMLRETYEALKSLEENYLGPQNVYSQRLLHTMKGNLSSFGLEIASQFIHEIEDKNSIKLEDVQYLVDTINNFLDSNKEVLGIQSLTLAQDPQFTVSLKQITQLKQLAAQYLGQQDSSFQHMTQSINQLATVSIRQLLLPLDHQLQQIAGRIGKPAELIIQGADIRTSPHLEKVIQHFPNLFRNALYHGIEEQHERNGKPWPPVLEIRLDDRGDRLLIELADDGRGINPEEIKRRALELKIISETNLSKLNEQELVDLVFADGMTTETKVNEISGRGNGMSAFKAEVIALGGTVHLVSHVGQGTKIIIELQKIQYEQPEKMAS